MTEHGTSSNSSRGRRQPRRSYPPELLELRQEVGELRRGKVSGRSSRGGRGGRGTMHSYRVRRRRLALAAVIASIVLVLVIDGTFATKRSFALPSRSSLAGLSVGQRIVAIANSQLGYSANPSHSYCNKFSAYWRVGAQTCPGAESSEEWCADFAAWAWQKAGIPFSYGFGPGEINAAAASFYAWGVAHGTWHSASSGYRGRPGDVAVYGLSLDAAPTATHVAIVTDDPPGNRGPNVVNGDGDRSGFSVVEDGTDQLRADTADGHGAPISGFVSPG